MKKSQINRGEKKRVMYVENEDGLLEGAKARISGIKKNGSNSHPAERFLRPVIEADAKEEYERIRNAKWL